jgi:alkylated DNA repair dioxygenase AlkB
MTNLPGLEQFARPKSPVKVVRGFLPFEQRLPLFRALESGSWDILKTRWGADAKRRTVTYYEGDESAANAYMNKFGDKGIHAIPYTQAPPELNAVRERLKEEYGLGLSLCYTNYYADETVQIGWHQDREEKGSKSPLLMVTLGGTRTFSIWKIKEDGQPKPEWEEETASGDLVEMPVGFHDDCKHAVLPQKHFAAARISLTFRNPDLSLSGPWAPKHSTIYQPAPDPAPKVWCCKAGRDYPKDAVYVGCKTVRGQKRDGSVFGNAVNPLKVRKKKSNPWAAPNEKSFREYAQRKMKEDAGFREQVEGLRGKDLLCWCKQDGPNKAAFCHARVWLEIVNR